MDSKIIAILAVAVVCVAGVGAFAIIGGDDGGDPSGITYHGNGGLYEGDASRVYPEANIPPCFFDYDGHKFYQWNTKADGTGDVYQPLSDTDYAVLKQKGVTDLYAIWVHTIKSTPLITCSDVLVGLLQHGQFADQLFGIEDVYLDPSETSTSLVIIPEKELGAPSDWTAEIGTDSVIVLADYNNFKYRFSFTEFSGATDFQFIKPDSKISAGIFFHYTGNVTFSFSAEKVYEQVTYHGNGGVHDDHGIIKDTRVLPLAGVLKASYFVNEGYSFVKWAENADGSGFSIEPGVGGSESEQIRILTDSGVRTLYAIWTPVP